MRSALRRVETDCGLVLPLCWTARRAYGERRPVLFVNDGSVGSVKSWLRADALTKLVAYRDDRARSQGR